MYWRRSAAGGDAGGGSEAADGVVLDRSACVQTMRRD